MEKGGLITKDEHPKRLWYDLEIKGDRGKKPALEAIKSKA